MLNNDTCINRTAVFSQCQILAAVTHCYFQTGSTLCLMANVNNATIMSIQQISCSSFQAALAGGQVDYAILAGFENVAVRLQSYTDTAVSSRFQNDFAGIIRIITCIGNIALLVAVSSDSHLGILQMYQALLIIVDAINSVGILAFRFNGYLTVPGTGAQYVSNI